MNTVLDAVLLLFTIAKVRGKEPELPLCPTNMQYFPQNLPMHCRMPPNANYPSMPQLQNPTIPPFPADFFQSPPPDKLPNPIPFPIPPGMPPGFPPGLPGLPPGMPGPMPMPMPIPMPAPSPAHKLPVIVMPFYSPDPSYKKPPQDKVHRGKRKRIMEIYTRRPPHYNSDSRSDTDTSSDTSSDSSSERGGWWKGGYRKSGRRMNRKHKVHKRRHGKKDLLTPILQYVTRDGYVIFEKKISKNEAKDWLSMKKKEEGKLQPDLSNVNILNRNNDLTERSPMNGDVELLDSHKDKSKEQADFQTHRTSKRHHPHKLRSQPKMEEEKEEDKEDEKEEVPQ